MEDRGYSGDDAEETTQPSLAAQEGFFASWLLKKNETEADTQEKDDEDEESDSSSDKKKKKQSAISRFISKLLGDDEAEDEKSFDNPVPEVETTEASIQHPIEADQLIAEVEDAVGENQPNPPEEQSLSGELRIDHNEDASPAQEIESENDLSANTVKQSSEQQPAVIEQYDMAAQRAAEQLDNQPTETVQASPERHYGGESDWKLKREIRRLKRRVKQQEAATKRIKAQAKEAEDQLETMQAQQRKFEASLVPDKQPEAKSSLQIEKQPKQEVSRTQELSPQIKLESKEPKAPIEKIITQERTKAAPEEVLKTVVEAVDNNVAIERQFERRHELKDQTTPAAQFSPSGATSVASILKQSSPNRLMAQPTPPTIMPTPPTALGTDQQTANISYGQAVAGGFAAAIVLLLLIALIIIAL